LADRQIGALRHYVDQLQKGEPVAWRRQFAEDLGPRLEQWVGDSALFGWLSYTPQNWYLAIEETDFRATKIVLALEAWRLEHGELPKTLDELAPSQLTAVPRDPAWNQPFLYYPEGLLEPQFNGLLLESKPDKLADLQDDWFEGRPQRLIRWEKIGRQPFLWSALVPDPNYQPVVLSEYSIGRSRVSVRGEAPIDLALRGQLHLTFYALEEESPWAVYSKLPNWDQTVLSAGQAYVIPHAEPEKR
jgi:hypothetical protein